MNTILNNNTDPRIETLANGLYNNNGGTYNIDSDSALPMSFKSGYMVGIKKGLVRCGFDLTPLELEWLITARNENPGSYIRTWYNLNNNLSYFDIVMRIAFLEDALPFAKSHNELAIWDNTHKCEIIL